MACRPSCTCRGFPGYTHNYHRMSDRCMSDHTNWLELQYVNTDTFKTSGPMMHDIPDWILTQHNVAQNVLSAEIYACWHRVWVRVKETGRVSPLEVAFVSSWDFHLDLLLTLKQVHLHKCQKQKIRICGTQSTWEKSILQMCDVQRFGRHASFLDHFLPNGGWDTTTKPSSDMSKPSCRMLDNCQVYQWKPQRHSKNSGNHCQPIHEI